MASSSRDYNSSDDETLHRVEKRKHKTRNIIDSNDSEEDSDIEVKPKKAVKLESDSEFPCDNSTLNDCLSNFTLWTDADEKTVAKDCVVANDSDGEPTCSVCLSKFSGQDIATPETCDHIFCSECLQEWAKIQNSCPIDRLKFNLILIRHHNEDKIIRRISVENPERFIEVESESTDGTFCELCGDCDNESTLLLCDECENGYHCECLSPPLESVPVGPWFCPDCASFIRLQERLLSDFHRMIDGRFRSNALSSSSSSRSLSNTLQSTVQHPTSRRAYIRKHHENGRRSQSSRLRRYYIHNSYSSSSDSSDDEAEHAHHDIASCFQEVKNRRLNRIPAHLGSTVRRKLRREMRNIGGSSNSLFSSATPVNTMTMTDRRDLDSSESDEYYNERFESGETSLTQSVINNGTPSITTFSSRLPTSSVPNPHNYDLVGTILQSQAILHCPRITVSRDGSLSMDGHSSREQQSTLDNATVTKDTHSSTETQTECSLSIFDVTANPNDALPIDSETTSVQQCPLNPMQKPSAKYSDAPHQTPSYSCDASTSGVGGSPLYDTSTISRTALGNSNLDQLSGSSHPVLGHRNFGNCSLSDDLKKDHLSSVSLKDSTKNHSEEEVDIYSDIESVGDEEAVTSDKVEPVKIDFKCDESSRLSNTNDEIGEGSDSSDNELVIDEDVPAEEEHEKLKGNIQRTNVSKDDKLYTSVENHQESGESNSSNLHPSNFNCPSNAETQNSDKSFGTMEDSSGANQHSITQETNFSQEIFSPQGSPVAAKQTTLSPKRKCDSESDIDMEIYDDNSIDSAKKSFRTESGTPCSIKSSPRPMEEHRSVEFESQFENSASNENMIFRKTSAFSSFRNENGTDDEQSKLVEDSRNESTQDSVDRIDENDHNSTQSFSSDIGEREDSQDINMLNTQDVGDQQEDVAVTSGESLLEPEEDISICDASNASIKANMNSEINDNLSQNENTMCVDERNEYEDNLSNIKNENSQSSDDFRIDSDVPIKNLDNCDRCNDSNNLDQNESIGSNCLEDQDEVKDSDYIKDHNGCKDSDKSHVQDGYKDSNYLDDQGECKDSNYIDDQDQCKDSNYINDQDECKDSNNIDDQDECKDSDYLEDPDEVNDPNSLDQDECKDSSNLETPNKDKGSNYLENQDSENMSQDLDQFGTFPEESENSEKDTQDNNLAEPGIVDLGIEDISEGESEDLNDDGYANDISSAETEQLTAEKQVENLFLRCELGDNFETDHGAKSLHSNSNSNECKNSYSMHSNPSFDDQEEGEIIEERPERKKNRKRNAKHDHYRDDNEDYGDLAPRVNISDLPRIPKIKRNREKKDVVEEISTEAKRTSVLGRVDLGSADISWKRLSKHTRERSYRDGRPKDEKLLYRERESKSKDKKNVENDRKSSKNREGEHRRDCKKHDSEKLKNERERKADKNKDNEKCKVTEWSYSVQEKHEKHERHSKLHKEKEKRSRDKEKREKERSDKNRYNKDDDKYERDKGKEDVRYEREIIRYDRSEEERFERVVYEKGKFKEKEHKSKRKDRKNDSTKSSTKERSREKHKHVHSNEHFSEKQKEREVRKIDDKLKIVLEQRESRKDKADKRFAKKEQKHDKKHREEIHHHEHKKKERSVSPYTELAPIESKEIFAKGDSIIINVNFNRASPKEIIVPEDKKSNSKEKKLSTDNIDSSEEISIIEIKTKTKNISDKRNTADVSINKRPTTPPERNVPVISVGECYWQETDETDANSITPEKSVEEIPVIEEEEEDTVGSAGYEVNNNYSSSSDSSSLPETQPVKQPEVIDVEQSPNVPEKSTEDVFPKETETFHVSRRRSPRSPSPPSPADNDSYDPCEPTKSPSPPPIPPAPPLPVANPKPPPSPELPPLPPDPEPTDSIIKEDQQSVKQAPPCPADFLVVTSAMAAPSQPIVVHTQTTAANPLSMSNILVPPPFLTHSTSNSSGIPTIQPLMPPSNFNFQIGNHPPMMFPGNPVQQVIRNNFVPTQMHVPNSMPHPSNAPVTHMGSVPPPPPPPHGTLPMMTQVRHPQLHGQLNANTLLQNIQLSHQVNLPQLHLTNFHLPPALANVLANHHSPMLVQSQNQPLNLPVTMHNQQVNRGVLQQNQIPNNALTMQNLNLLHLQTQNNSLNQTQHSQVIVPSFNSTQKSERLPKHPSPIDKSQVIDMDVDSPYSPGDSPSLDSAGDYSPTCSPISSPKNSNAVKDAFDSLIPTEQKLKNQQLKSEKHKIRSDSRNATEASNKKARLDSKTDSVSKNRHSVRMNKLSRKEQKLAEKKELSKLDDSQLTILDELPSSAVEMQVKEKFLKKLNRQERVIEEVKMVLKPYYKSRDVTKEEYKDILRKAVPKICHNKSGEINPVKVKCLIESYVKKVKHAKKKSRKSRKSSKFS